MKKYIILTCTAIFFFSILFSCQVIDQEKVYSETKVTESLDKLAPIFTETLKENTEFISFIKA
jgi:hypothetical protein